MSGVSAPRVTGPGKIQLKCEENQGDAFLKCLGNQAALNYAIKEDPHLAKIFSDRKNSLEGEPELKDRFSKDGDYQKIFNQLSLDTLYNADSGVTEGYSVGVHTSMALLIYETQKIFFKATVFSDVGFVKNFDRFMKFLVAYHDIGKGFSAAIYPDKGRNRDEILFSYPIAWRLMLTSGFSEKESKLAILLIHVHKIIGDYLVGKIPAATASAEFINNAKIAEVSSESFFRFAEFLFIADAASYPYLRGKIFVTDEQSGRITPKEQERIEALRETIRKNSQTKTPMR